MNEIPQDPPENEPADDRNPEDLDTEGHFSDGQLLTLVEVSRRAAAEAMAVWTGGLTLQEMIESVVRTSTERAEAVFTERIQQDAAALREQVVTAARQAAQTGGEQNGSGGQVPPDYSGGMDGFNDGPPPQPQPAAAQPNVMGAVGNALQADPLSVITTLLDQVLDKGMRIMEMRQSTQDPLVALDRIRATRPELLAMYTPAPMGPEQLKMMSDMWAGGARAAQKGAQVAGMDPSGKAGFLSPDPLVPTDVRGSGSGELATAPPERYEVIQGQQGPRQGIRRRLGDVW